MLDADRPIPRAMDSHARGLRRTGSVAARAALVVAACLAMLVIGGTAAAATPASQDSVRSLSDAQLADEVARRTARAEAIGERLLAEAAQRGDIERERDAAQRLLAAFLADAYMHGGMTGGMAEQVLSSSSLMEVADRVRVAQVVGDYHGSILRTLDGAEARIDVGKVERASLVAELSVAQRRVVELQEEQGRRAEIRAAHEAERERREAERTAARAQAQRESAAAISSPGVLVGATGSTFVAPGGPPSAAAIDAYLASKGSPMVGQGAAFMASGMRWQVDPRLLVAIAGAESSFGQITCGPNNAWGWACPNDPADFATWAAGIDTVTEGLRRYYLDEGRTSVSLIQQKYCPVGAANDPTGLNNHWTTNVTKFLVELGGNPAMVGPGPSGASSLQLPGFGLIAAD
jgi:hypothetical protein